ncbi:MAG: PIN domain-containing protein [Mycobacteriales bacterium]
MSADSHGYVLDAGAFIAIERRVNRVGVLFEQLRRSQTPMITSAGVVAQVWRGGSGRQVPLAVLLSHTTVVDLTKEIAKALGMMLKLSATSDPIDAHVVHLARERGWPVLTSDPGDLRAIDPTLNVEAL